ncbi:hypothetical protein L3Q82_012180 [Scortum barcoo]|uniref:Uncharacterized protein n=1 Tax=Scortum barcoo TaxID=214431 RepID=A0ACB8W2F8_9TELE|nr:hypothetical protein L3Q82_012180 [Scortum barcoo]
MTQLWWDGSLTTTRSDYRQEVEHLEGWCRQNNLCINVKKTKEMIVDFRRGRHLPPPLYIRGTAVEVVSSFRKFVGRAEKAYASKAAYKPDSVTPGLSGKWAKIPANYCEKLVEGYPKSLTSHTV